MVRDAEISEDAWLMLQIDRTPGDADTKERIKNLLRGLAGKRLYFTRRALLLPARLERAIQLLEAGHTLAEVKAALLSSGMCNSKKTAHRVVCLAVNERSRQRQLVVDSADEFRAIVTRNSLTGVNDDA